MKRLFATVIGTVATIVPLIAASGIGPQPESCSVGSRLFTAPLEEIGFYFDGGISLLKEATAVIKCDDVNVATCDSMKVSNYTSSKRTQGALLIYFDGRLLPTGKDYIIAVPSGSVAFEADNMGNEEFSQRFSVPSTVGNVSFEDEQGMIIERISHNGRELPTFYWPIETESECQPSFTLFREGIAVRQFQASVGWDWDLGQARAIVEDEMRFENGVHYSLMLPAGSVHARLRDDIVNEDAVFNFVGGCKESIAPLNYHWCSLTDNPSDVLDEVIFSYDRTVSVANNARFQLWETDRNILIMEADARLNTDINCFGVSADFGGLKMEPGVGYTLVIPEGTVIAATGDPVVNSRCSISLNDGSGVTAIVSDKIHSGKLHDLCGRPVVRPQRGNIYIRAGHKTLIR